MITGCGSISESARMSILLPGRHSCLGPRGAHGCYYAGGDRPFHTNRDHGGGAEHRLLRSIYRCANHARDLAAASGPDPAFVARGGAILLSLADGKLCPARCMAPAFR